jgi:hypothetical protein
MPHRRPSPQETLQHLKGSILPQWHFECPEPKEQADRPARPLSLSERLLADLEEEKERLMADLHHFREKALMHRDLLRLMGIDSGNDW